MIRRTVDRGALTGSAVNAKAQALVETVVMRSTDQVVGPVREHLGISL